MSYTLTTSYAIVLKCGVGIASTTAASNAIIAKFCDQAEGVINTLTRKDWVADYSTITTNFKPILDDAASDYAAMKLIAYDLDAYSKVLMAQTMIDLMRDNFERSISALKQDEIKSVMD